MTWTWETCQNPVSDMYDKSDPGQPDGHPRYRADYAPDDNSEYPWHVMDDREGTFIGPCFDEADAAVIAWALNHRHELPGRLDVVTAGLPNIGRTVEK